MTGPVIPVCTCSPARIDGYVIHRQDCARYLARKQAERPAESTAVVPAAAIEALASDLRKSAKGIRQATGDHQDGREYEAAADRLDALVAEHQTSAAGAETAQALGDVDAQTTGQPSAMRADPAAEPAPEVRLTDEERESLRYAWHDGTCPEGHECRSRYLHMMATSGWDAAGESIASAVEAIVASRTAELRAEAERLRAELAEIDSRVTGARGIHRRNWVAERDLAAIRERVAALHRPIRVYDECEHDEDHGCEPVEVYDYMGCSESVIGWACETCCYEHGEYPREDCPHGADHQDVTEAESCPTLAALGGEGE